MTVPSTDEIAPDNFAPANRMESAHESKTASGAHASWEIVRHALGYVGREAAAEDQVDTAGQGGEDEGAGNQGNA